MESRQKNAYLELYKKVSNEIGTNFEDKLIKLADEDKRKELEMKKENMSSNQMTEEMIKKEKERIR